MRRMSQTVPQPLSKRYLPLWFWALLTYLLLLLQTYCKFLGAVLSENRASSGKLIIFFCLLTSILKSVERRSPIKRQIRRVPNADCSTKKRMRSQRTRRLAGSSMKSRSHAQCIEFLLFFGGVGGVQSTCEGGGGGKSFRRTLVTRSTGTGWLSYPSRYVETVCMPAPNISESSSSNAAGFVAATNITNHIQWRFQSFP